MKMNLHTTQTTAQALLKALIAAGVLCAAQLASAQSASHTVEEVMRLEDQAMLEKARTEAGLAAAANAPVRSSKTASETAATLAVNSVIGVGGSVRASINLNGATSLVGVGQKAGPVCEVASIDPKGCVALRPVGAKTAANQCPTACWTGQSALPPQFAGMPLGRPGPGTAAGSGVMPTPLPTQATPGAPGLLPAGVPTGGQGAQGGIQQPAAQPTVQVAR